MPRTVIDEYLRAQAKAAKPPTPARRRTPRYKGRALLHLLAPDLACSIDGTFPAVPKRHPKRRPEA